MNRDQLFMVNARDAIKAAYAALSGAQAERPPLQVMGIAVLFHEVCNELHLDPSEMLSAARRVNRNATDHYSHELKALGMYIQQELK